MRKRHITWLYDELPKLVRAGVLSEDSVGLIRGHYGEVPQSDRSRIALMLFAIIGTFLIGSGIILLLGHNWQILSRPMRVVLSFAPLAIAQAIGAWTLLKRATSLAWREGTAILIASGIGASIALIGQTYHIPGNLESYLFVWVLLALPLIYIFNSTTCALLYMIGVVSWAGAAQGYSGHSIMFWPLMLAVFPHIWLAQKDKVRGARLSLLCTALALALTIGVGISLEKALPGLWIIVYTSMFALMFMAGKYWLSDGFASPLRGAGALGMVVMSLILTFDDSWHRIGHSYYRSSWRYNEMAATIDYILAGILLIGVTILAVQEFRKRDWASLLWGSGALLAVICFAMGTSGLDENFMLALFNIYLFALALATIISGIRNTGLLELNAGMGIMALLVITRFFDSSLPMTIRALVFIALGTGFLIANLVMSRRKRNIETSERILS